MRSILTIMGVAAGLYVLLAATLYWMQERLVFLPNLPGRVLETTPRVLGLDYQDVRFETDDGVLLHGWYVRAPESRGTVLFFHGNAGNISHRLDSISIFVSLGLDVFIIDYRGYGQSEGKPGEQGTYLDADAAWRYLVDTRGLDPARIVIFGRSLGAAVAARLGADTRAAALIVESSFTSAEDMAARLYPFLPVRLLTRLRYPVAEFIAQNRNPVLIVHARQDEIIPFEMGRELYRVASAPKAFLELTGDHNGGFLISRDRYVDGLDTFMTEHLDERTRNDSRYNSLTEDD